MKVNYNWAILGAGLIAEEFAEGLSIVPNAVLYAVGSRSIERADSFKQRHGCVRAYDSYAQMLADPEVDIVYIATTNNVHFEHTMMCLEAGKAVLCEKPFASNLQQVRLMVAKAKEKNVFLMEALWTRFIPSMIELKKQLELGSIGRPKMLQCDFGLFLHSIQHTEIMRPNWAVVLCPILAFIPFLRRCFSLVNPNRCTLHRSHRPQGPIGLRLYCSSTKVEKLAC